MRPRRGTSEPSKYRYKGYAGSEGWVAPLEECEENGNHRVTPQTWPPPRTAASVVDPSLNMQCELCGAWLVVYEGHADQRLQGIDVVLPKEFAQK